MRKLKYWLWNYFYFLEIDEDFDFIIYNSMKLLLIIN